MAKIFKGVKSTGQGKGPTNANLVGKVISLEIERLDINGVGVGKYQKKSVFVENSLVGEKVAAKVLEQNSKLIRAKAQKVTNVSKDRVKPKCQHYYQCGGCDLQHLSHEGQLSFKLQKVAELFSRQGISELNWANPVTAEPWQYRRKARIGIQYNKLGEAIVGFRKKSSNTLTDINECKTLLPVFDGVFSLIRETLSEANQAEALGHIEVISGQQTTVVLRVLRKLSTASISAWQFFEKKLGCRVLLDDGSGVSFLSKRDDNSDISLSYDLLNQTLSFTPNSFIQVNPSVNQAMVAQAIDWLSLEEGEQVLDLFCGIGNFSLPIAEQVSNVIGVEGVDTMVVQASENAASNALDNARFYQIDLNSDWQHQPWRQHKFDKVLLDPARAGAEQACQQVLSLDAEKILYVSCEPSTLARDAKILIDGGYQLKKVGLIDMFSQTKHVETMVLFEREAR